MLGVVVLVILLRLYKRPGLVDLCHDLAVLVLVRALQCCDVCLGLVLLLIACGKDGGAVLRAAVRALSIELSGVVKLEEPVK